MTAAPTPTQTYATEVDLVGALERARVRKSRWMYVVLSVTGLGFFLLCLALDSPLGSTVVTVVVAVVTGVGAAAITPENYRLADRFVSLFGIGCLGLICVALPNLATTTLFAPLALYVASVERSRRWRRGLLAVVGFGFLGATWLAGGGLRDRAADLDHFTVAFELHCLIAGAVVAFIALTNRTLLRRTYAAAAAQTDRITAHNTTLAAANDALAVNRERLAAVRLEVKAAIDAEALTQRRLAAAREPLRQFALAASHDLKEPIRTIRSFMLLVRRDLPDDLRGDAGAAEDFAFVETGCAHMQGLLDKLLAYHRTGEDAGAAEAVDLRRLWLVTLRAVAAERLATRRARPDGPGATPAQLARLREADPAATFSSDGEAAARLPRAYAERLLAELLHNALTYHDGEREIEVGLRVRSLPGGRVECRVTDNGIGVDPRFRERVFGMFKRLHPREHYPGSGLGLTLARRICAAVGGEIALAEAGGVGTCVRVVLPAAREAEHPAAA